MIILLKASTENRTRINCLEGNDTNRYTMEAQQ